MLNAGQSGFMHAPVTKVIIVLVVLSTVFGSIIGSQARLTLRVPKIVSNAELWRLLTHHFIFTTPGELLFGVVLLYFFRQFERQMGSSRFSAYALITSTTYTALLCVLSFFSTSLVPTSGPYSLIFASIVYFFFETPKIYQFQLLGAFELSDKSFVYFLALQLIISSQPQSLVSCMAAILAGLVYRIPMIRDYADVPDAISIPFSSHVLPLLGTTPTVSSRTRYRRRQNGTDPASAAFGRQAPPFALQDVRSVSEANVDTLVAMGFSRDDAVAALERSRDDVQIATEQLLSAS